MPAPIVAIVGAGFSGTITALHLLRTLPSEWCILLCERAPSFGAGPAYGTRHPDHLLNVRAANMSAFGDQPDRPLGVQTLQRVGRPGIRSKDMGRAIRVRQIAHRVRLRARDGTEEDLRVQRIISATGVESASRCGDRLLTSLLARGLARLDPSGLGISVTEALQVVDAEGRAASDLWALGPIVRGVFWECTAVPDIRVQAQKLAAQVARA